jgi:hypothetical protein
MKNPPRFLSLTAPGRPLSARPVVMAIRVVVAVFIAAALGPWLSARVGVALPAFALVWIPRAKT